MENTQTDDFFSFVKELKVLPIFALILSSWGCVGPTTPFGAIHRLTTPSQLKFDPSVDPAADPSMQPPSPSKTKMDKQGFYAPAPSPPRIELFPNRQVLHSRRDLKVVIFDPKGIAESSRWRVYYNGYEVTHQLIPTVNEVESISRKEWTLEFKNLRVRAEKDNHIQFAYFTSPNQPPVIRSWLPPECHMDQIQQIATTEAFTLSANLLDRIDRLSRDFNFNPSLLAGLVAQESAFNPQAISWAKAIGLTQVTPIADLEIARFQPLWPRSASISRFPAGIVKGLINAGKLTARDDWRLNPELSLRGGLTFLNYLANYWAGDPVFSQLKEKSAFPKQLATQIILASYQSGASRVKKAILENNQNFLTSENLMEARKYVGRVSSYCYHFSNREDLYANSP